MFLSYIDLKSCIVEDMYYMTFQSYTIAFIIIKNGYVSSTRPLRGRSVQLCILFDEFFGEFMLIIATKFFEIFENFEH